MVDCYHVTQRASLDHLGALRVLQSSGTDLPRATIVACRVRGCFAPADGILCKLPSTASVALIAGTRLVRCAHDGCVSLCDTSRGRDIVAPLQIRINYLHCSAIAVLADGHRVAIGMAPSYPYWGGVSSFGTHGAFRALPKRPPAYPLTAASECTSWRCCTTATCWQDAKTANCAW